MNRNYIDPYIEDIDQLSILQDMSNKGIIQGVQRGNNPVYGGQVWYNFFGGYPPEANVYEVYRENNLNLLPPRWFRTKYPDTKKMSRTQLAHWEDHFWYKSHLSY